MILQLCLLALLAQNTPPSVPKPPKYDPDNLGPGEVACGRASSVKSPPCACMKARMAKQKIERDKCLAIFDDKKRMQCYVNIPRCMPVIDAEHSYDENQQEMPVECKRTCSKAKCECCHS